MTQPAGAVLRVGEERRINVPEREGGEEGAERVAIEVVYERNGFVSGSDETVVARVEQGLTRRR